jgi:DNA topoisomerase IA
MSKKEGKNLVIVESPGKIKKIQDVLGKEKYITLILEQLYSDMYMEAKTNPNDNTGLKIIKNRIFKRDFYD